MVNERGVLFLDKPRVKPKPATSNCLSCAAVNGGTTGAMVRQTTGPGFTRVRATWTLPDFQPSAADPPHEQPWVYYGFGDEKDDGVDMEVGFGFQKGVEGNADKPHRWLPYMRLGASFFYASEADRVLPGDRFTFDAWFDDGMVMAAKDGKQLFFVSPRHASHPSDDERESRSLYGHSDIAGVLMPKLQKETTHIRRVVGLAVGVYDGGRLAHLGPVVFEQTRAWRSDGVEKSFRDVATWFAKRGGKRYGTVSLPASDVQNDSSAERDSITLFP